MNETPRAANTFASLAAGVYGLGILAWVATHLSPDVRWDGDVINRAVLEGYAKDRETIVFLLACAIVPLTCVIALLASRLLRLSPRGTLPMIPALTCLLCWPLVCTIGGQTLGTGLIISAAAFAAFLSLASFAGRGRRAAISFALEQDAAPLPTLGGVRPTILSRESLGCILLAGIGLGTAAAFRLGTGRSDFRAVTAWAAIGGVLAAGAAWAVGMLAAGRRASCPGIERTLRGALLPLSGLALLNLHPSSAAFGSLLVTTVVVACILGAAIQWNESPSTPRRPWSLLLGLWSARAQWWIWAPLALYCTCFVYDVAGPIDPYHEGERITPAAAIADGAAPYRDVFLWHGLFENGIKGQLGLARGESILEVRRVERLLDPLAVVSLYALLAACLGSPALGLLAAIVGAYTLPSPNGRYWLPYLVYAAMALWLVGRRRHRWLAFLGGLLAAWAVFYSLDGGLAAALAAGCTLAYGHLAFPRDGGGPRGSLPRDAMAFSAGALAGALVPLVYLAYHHAIGAFVNASMDIAGGLSDRSSVPIRGLDLLGMIVAEDGAARMIRSKIFPLFLSALAIIWGLAHLAAQRVAGAARGSSLTLPSVAIGAAAFFRAVIRRPDNDHVSKILPLVFVVLAVLIHHHASRIRVGRRGWPGSLLHGLLLVVLVAIGMRVVPIDPETGPARALSRRMGSPTADADLPMRQLKTARAGKGVTALPWVEPLVDYLRGALAPGEPFYDFTNKGLLYFLADRPCPTRYVQTTYAASRAAQREVVAALERERPELVVFPSGDPWKYGYDNLIHPLRHPIITRYLYRHFSPATVVADAVILRRAETGPPRVGPKAEAFLSSAPFIADVGHLPRLQGELPCDSDLCLDWRAGDIADTWRGPPAREIVRTESGGDALRVSFGRMRRLSSPEISVVPDGAHTIFLTASLDTEGEARLLFSSSSHEELDGSAAMVFHMKGDSAPHTYRIDVGLLPAWVWRGTVTRLQFEFPVGVKAVDIHSIQLRAYGPDGPAAGSASSVGSSPASEREVSGAEDELPTRTQSP